MNKSKSPTFDCHYQRTRQTKKRKKIKNTTATKKYCKEKKIVFKALSKHTKTNLIQT